MCRSLFFKSSLNSFTGHKFNKCCAISNLGIPVKASSFNLVKYQSWAKAERTVYIIGNVVWCTSFVYKCLQTYISIMDKHTKSYTEQTSQFIAYFSFLLQQSWWLEPNQQQLCFCYLQWCAYQKVRDLLSWVVMRRGAYAQFGVALVLFCRGLHAEINARTKVMQVGNVNWDHRGVL